MDLTYGHGQYIEQDLKLDGQIILTEHKLLLRQEGRDLTRTYIPLEKISVVRLQNDSADFFIKPTVSFQYWATISGETNKVKQLVEEIVKRRGLKKKFLKKEWYEEG